MIRIISFDIGNTLIESNGKSKIQEIEELIKRDRKEFIKDYKVAFQTNTKDFTEQIKWFLKHINTDEKDYQQMYDGIVKIFQNAKTKQKDYVAHEKVEAIKKLREQGYIVIALSNLCKYLNTQKDFFEKLDLFDRIFYSYDIGYCKPDKRIFKYIEKIYGVESNEIIHIGDSLKSDYNASIKSGWKALLYDPKNCCKQEKIKKIKNFKEINNYIKK